MAYWMAAYHGVLHRWHRATRETERVDIHMTKNTRRAVTRGGVLLLALGLPIAIGARATADYARGEATLLGFGIPTDPIPLDRELRVRYRSGGCVPDLVHSLIVHPIHNATLRVLALLLGPMPGAYSGAYPTAAQAFARIESAGADVSVTELWNEPSPGGLEGFGPGHRRWLDQTLLPGLEHGVFGPAGWRIALFEDEAVLVATPADERGTIRIVVLSLETAEYLRTYHAVDSRSRPATGASPTTAG